jgi:HK97 family phage major capsid protein
VEAGDQEDSVKRVRGERLGEVTDEARTALDDLVRSSDAHFAEQLIGLSRPAYHTAFEMYLRGEDRYWDDEQRAAARTVASLTGEELRTTLLESNTGAVAVPTFLSPEILIQNSGSSNPFRRLASHASINTQTWTGIGSAGITAEVTGEAVEVADATPTLASLSITPLRCDMYAELSAEMIADADAAGQLMRLFQDGKDNLEAVRMATGSTAGLTGVITTISATTASRVQASTGGSFGAVDCFALDNAVPSRYRSNASWVANWAVYSQIRQFSISPSPASSNFWVDMAPQAGGSLLLGHGTYESSAMTSTMTTAGVFPLIIGDFSAGFKVVDRVTAFVLRSDWIVGASNRPKGVTGFAFFWRVGCGVIDASAFRLLKL